jgi:formylglycine-generating enzyme required for sulfatase activity
MEGEWKKAARAGSSSSFYWGNENPDAYSWHKGNADKNSPYRFQKKQMF